MVHATDCCRWLDLYSDAIGVQYARLQAGQRGALSPHVFSTSAIAYDGLSRLVSQLQQRVFLLAWTHCWLQVWSVRCVKDAACQKGGAGCQQRRSFAALFVPAHDCLRWT